MEITMYSDIVGKTIEKILTEKEETLIPGISGPSEELKFFFTDGSVWRMYHYQDCCESVMLEDIAGNIQDLIGSPLLEASERTEDHSIAKDYDDSCTWTFYRFSTIKGTVVLRWEGYSNGFYSESVNFEEVKNAAN